MLIIIETKNADEKFHFFLFYAMKKALENQYCRQTDMYVLPFRFFNTFFRGRSKNKKIYGSIFQSVTDIGLVSREEKKLDN